MNDIIAVCVFAHTLSSKKILFISRCSSIKCFVSPLMVVSAKAINPRLPEQEQREHRPTVLPQAHRGGHRQVTIQSERPYHWLL